MCGKIVGITLNDLNDLYKARTLKEVDPSHPLQNVFKLLPSSRRYCLPLCRTNRFKNYFITSCHRFLKLFLFVVAYGLLLTVKQIALRGSYI